MNKRMGLWWRNE